MLALLWDYFENHTLSEVCIEMLIMLAPLQVSYLMVVEIP